MWVCVYVCIGWIMDCDMFDLNKIYRIAFKYESSYNHLFSMETL